MHKSVLYLGRIFDFFDILSGPCWYAVAGSYCPVHAGMLSLGHIVRSMLVCCRWVILSGPCWYAVAGSYCPVHAGMLSLGHIVRCMPSCRSITENSKQNVREERRKKKRKEKERQRVPILIATFSFCRAALCEAVSCQ